MEYHSKLATYFRSRPLYLDDTAYQKPNIRKLMELPWQELEAAISHENGDSKNQDQDYGERMKRSDQY